MNRREIVMGGASLVAAGSAFALEPRRTLNLLGDRKMDDVLPSAFGLWTSAGETGLVRPETQGKLAAKLYSELVSRIYRNSETFDEVMMLVAYGKVQSDLLQLHRPESCYPAVGFRITSASEAPILLSGGVAIPARRVVAERSSATESIVYWVRLGEFLPANDYDQRLAVLTSAMQGVIPDGALFRLSSIGDPKVTFPILNRFASELLTAVDSGQRKSIVGTALSRKATF